MISSPIHSLAWLAGGTALGQGIVMLASDSSAPTQAPWSQPLRHSSRPIVGCC